MAPDALGLESRRFFRFLSFRGDGGNLDPLIQTSTLPRERWLCRPFSVVPRALLPATSHLPAPPLCPALERLLEGEFFVKSRRRAPAFIQALRRRGPGAERRSSLHALPFVGGEGFGVDFSLQAFPSGEGTILNVTSFLVEDVRYIAS